MAGGVHDPYEILGVGRSASDAELRAAYRRLVQLHHPDHNAGSAESARRFEDVQDAYAAVRAQRRTGASSAKAPPRRRSAPPRAETPRSAPADPHLESRLADLERQLKEAGAARERARRAAREAARETAATRESPRASDEELGYVSTDDSFSKILSDAAAELSDRFSETREHPLRKRVADLIDELGSKLTGEPPKP